MNSRESGSNALEFKFVEESLSVTSTSEWSYKSTFDRVAGLRRILREFGRRGRGLVERVVELGEDAEDIYGWTTTGPGYFACSDAEQRGLVVAVVVVVVVDGRGREGGYGEGVGEVNGARGDDPDGFGVVSSVVITIKVGIRLLRRHRARCPRSAVLLRGVFERIGRRRRPQPRHGGRQ